MSGTWDELIQEIKSRLDIVDVVSEQVILKRRGNTYWGLCPFHKDKHPSFAVTPSMGIYKCFSCGEGGDAIKFIMKTKNMEFREVIEDLAQKFGLEVPKTHKSNGSTRELKDQMLKATEIAAEFYHDLLLRNKTENAELALAYLTKRGIGQDIIKKFHLGIAPKAYTSLYDELRKDFSNDVLEKAGLVLKSEKGGFIDRFRNRVIIPIQNENGQFIAFGARAIEEGQNPKYLNSSDSLIYNKSKTLYGLYTAKDAIKAEDSVIIMEGYFDVISSQAHGIENCVASCGTALTQDHIRLLSRYTKSRRIYLSFDTDSAGQKATAKGASIIKEVFAGLGNIKQFDESYIASNPQSDRYACEIRVIAPPEGKDPDEFVRSVGADAYKMYMQNAPLYIDFRINSILKDKDNYKTPQEKAQYISTIIPVLGEIQNPIIREEYTQTVAGALGIDSSVIKTELESYYRANIPRVERIVKNVTKNDSVVQKAQKILLSVFFVPDSHLTFTQINEMIGETAFNDEILIIVKSTIDKLICSVNNVKELIEHLYTEFVDNPDAQAILPELVEHAQAYKDLSEEEFRNVIKEAIAKINKCKHVEEVEHIKKKYKGIDDNDPEALKIQIQLRDKLRMKKEKSEMN
ncbi:MAG: DNA primase [Cyanobacteriota bacterium]|nr:DNA primase [Cyanobacteriota bacterium]MDY6359033.1 DNA primase [Cyanobacteriota bacterium]MDY6363475.1 DNA primase [Cyanobacteriota bacterium]MDY6382678.1 DNA primase [Cyanobacteriota bacterium]